MSAARNLAGLGNQNTFAVESVANEVGIASTAPSSTLDVRGEVRIGTAVQLGSAGVITATSFSGSGANLTGLATTETVRADTLTVAGVSTLTGAVNVDATTDSTSATTGALIVDGGVGIAKNVYIGAGLSVAGTLTYEDVTSVDSVGLITAKSGVNVTGGQLQVGVAYSVGAAGVATAAGFVGGTIAGSTGTFTGDVDIADKIVHTGDTNTALRFPSADTITAETGGSERLRIASDGDMGVGTASPSVRLHVNGGDGLLVERSSGTSVAGFKQTGGTSMNIYLQNSGSTNHPSLGSDSQDLTLGTNNLERVRVTSAGKVGIGSEIPSELLSIMADGPCGLELKDSGHGEAATTIKIGNQGRDLAVTVPEDLNYTLTSGNYKVTTGGTERVRITSAGVIDVNGGDVELCGTAAGVSSVTWDASANSLIFNDSSEARFGDGGDLRIWHDGTNTHIVNNTGYLNIQAKDGENSVFCQADGEVNLYYNNSKKLATQQYGVDVQDALFIKGAEGTSAILHLMADEADDNADSWRIVNDTSDNILYFQNYTTGSYTTTLKLNPNGAVEDSKGDVRRIIETVHSSAHTLVSADAGKVINISTGGVTIAANQFIDGDAVTIVNNSGSNQTITCSAVSMYLAGTTSLKTSLTLSGRGMATFICMGGNVFYGSGGGLS